MIKRIIEVLQVVVLVFFLFFLYNVLTDSEVDCDSPNRGDNIISDQLCLEPTHRESA
jgi:hypothetical protein